ncbi:hypothetical protein NMY22_g3776 [Coprinellus aureogranulatus]|nr:hypothetical protein NMY22_g3776 [Coprinellus aureogranulatus]
MESRKRKRTHGVQATGAIGSTSGSSGTKSRRMAVCTCAYAKCGDKTYVDKSGVTCRGQYIPYSTKRGHVKKDEETGRQNLEQLFETHPKNSAAPQATAEPPNVEATSAQPSESGPTLPATLPAPTHHPYRRLYAEVQEMDRRGSAFMRMAHTVYLLTSMVAVWLFVVGHLSREATNVVLKIVGLIVSTVLQYTKAPASSPSP